MMQPEKALNLSRALDSNIMAGKYMFTYYWIFGLSLISFISTHYYRIHL